MHSILHCMCPILWVFSPCSPWKDGLPPPFLYKFLCCGTRCSQDAQDHTLPFVLERTLLYYITYMYLASDSMLVYNSQHAYTLTYINRKSINNTVTDEKRQFLESNSLQIYPAVAGQLHRLSRLPPQTDIHEWLATNCE